VIVAVMGPWPTTAPDDQARALSAVIAAIHAGGWATAPARKFQLRQPDRAAGAADGPQRLSTSGSIEPGRPFDACG